MNKADKAESLFRTGYNCSQSVYAAFAEELGITVEEAAKKQLYVLVQKLCGSFEASEGSLICRELLGLEKGEDLEEPAVRTEAYYQSRPCVKACRRAAEILEEYVKEQKRK